MACTCNTKDENEGHDLWCETLRGRPEFRSRAVSAETLTDEEIRSALDCLPRGHYSTQWYLDAMGPFSSSHPHRKANARRAVAAAMNELIVPSACERSTASEIRQSAGSMKAGK